ncbi:hypothetical protein Tco_1003662 [Tanacetum coccineum]|uniref:Uncharacterized protein n=1 Tax=Tanacetum coccineum TaxID=301880 RepID=A0ABQ5FAP5_9ASTR
MSLVKAELFKLPSSLPCECSNEGAGEGKGSGEWEGEDVILERSESPRHSDSERKTVFKRLGRKKKGVLNSLGVKEDVCLHTRMTPDLYGTGTPIEKQRAATRVSIQGNRSRSQKALR